MIIKIDEISAECFGRTRDNNKSLYYYTVEGYPLVLLRTSMPIEGLTNRPSVAKVNSGEGDRATRGDLVCQRFPDAPAFWKDLEPGQLVQVSLLAPPANWSNRVEKRQHGRQPLLSAFLDEKFSNDRRKIRPHKGGRVVMKNCRVTPEVAELLAEIKAQHGATPADVLEWGARNFTV